MVVGEFVETGFVGKGEGAGDEAGFVPEDASGVDDGRGWGGTLGEGVGDGVGVGHGFSRESHSCQEAASLPPNSFQSAWQRSDQCL